MAKRMAGMVMVWDRPGRGHEGRAAELFQHCVGFWKDHLKRKEIDSFEPVIFSAHAGNVNGLFLIRGDADKLSRIRQTDEYLQLVIQCNHMLDGFGAFPAYIGDGVDKVLKVYNKNI